MKPPLTSNFAKHSTGNPVVRWLIRRYFNVLHRIVLDTRPKSILDVGCGEGFTAKRILGVLPNIKYTGIDANKPSIEYAREHEPQANFQCLNLFDARTDQFNQELVICLEVLEHIEDSSKLLSLLSRWSMSKLVVSVPWEPYFRLGNFLRGKYVKQLGNHPEHIHQFNKTSLKQLLSKYSENITVITSFPWLFAVCDLNGANLGDT